MPRPLPSFVIALLLAAPLLAGAGLPPGATRAGAVPVVRPRLPARPAPSEAPKALGKFEDWTAATHGEDGQTVCYAFTRASASSPVLPGRGDVVLTVTERASGRDEVAISAGFAYPANAEVSVEVDAAKLDFYTAQRSAFARDGHAAVAAFGHGRTAVAHAPGPRNAQVSDSFSLRGFAAAYAAILKACPAR